MWVLRILKRSLQFRRIANEELQGRVSTYLEAWDLPASDCLVMMRATRTILAGSTALAVVEPASWFPNGLDFFCPDSGYVNVCSWLERRGYNKKWDVAFASTVPETLAQSDFVFPPGTHPLPRIRGNINSGVRCAATPSTSGRRNQSRCSSPGRKTLRCQSASRILRSS